MTMPFPQDPQVTKNKKSNLSQSKVVDENFEQYHHELKEVERKISGEIDPGLHGLIIAVGVICSFLFLLLPHAGYCRGVDIISDNIVANTEMIGLASYIFVWFVLIFNVAISALALITHRWIIAWIAAAGSFISVVFAVLSIWLRHTPSIHVFSPSSPGLGLYLGTLSAILLVFEWMRLIWSRTNYHLAVEAQIREIAENNKSSKL